ncbi:MAG: universal stress protein [Planctomycetes bacterium]|nr:universal stress protein [Planctomycetota bacterium]
MLVATDFSPTSQRALLFVTRLPSPRPRLRLLHAFDPGPYGFLAVFPEAVEKSRASLEREARAARERGFRCETRLVFGRPEEVIRKEAERFRASVVACGTHGRRGFARLILGSVSERLLLSGGVPLLLVPHVPLRRRLRCVLVATDFSPASRRALDLGESLASGAGARLLVLHVLDPGLAAGAAFLTHPGFLEELRRRREEAAKSMGEVRTRLARLRVESETRIEAGDASERILRTADRDDVDLIVIGTRGRRRLERFLIGSVARRVVRGTPCPVLVVPPA